MSANTRTLLLAPFDKFLVPYWVFFSFLCIWDVAHFNCYSLLPIFNHFYPFSIHHIALRGGGLTRKPIFPTPPPPSLAAVTGGGGSGRGRPTCRPAVPGGGGSAQHLWLKMIPTSR